MRERKRYQQLYQNQSPNQRKINAQSMLEKVMQKTLKIINNLLETEREPQNINNHKKNEVRKTWKNENLPGGKPGARPGEPQAPRTLTIQETSCGVLQKNKLKEEQLQKVNLQRNKTLDVF